jgi:hypothetical protein
MREFEDFRKSAGFLRDNAQYLQNIPMKDRHARVTAPAGFDGQATRRDYYFKTRNAAREFRLRIKRWKAEQKYPADTLSFDDSDKRWLAYLRAHVGNLELLPAIVTHWERTAKPITRPLKVEELCKAFVFHRALDNRSARGCQTNSAKNGQSTFYSDGSRVASLASPLSKKGGASRSPGR